MINARAVEGNTVGTSLNALDLAFLALETQRSPVNVAGLVILEIPEDYEGNFIRDLLEQLREQPAGPPFNLRLSTTLPFVVPEWEEDDHFDLDYHVRHSALPKPGTRKELLQLVSRLHSRVMDRERPLWEFHVIEGMPDNQFAIYMKMHHAAIDGMGGIEILESCFTEETVEIPRAPWSGLSKKTRRHRTTGLIGKAVGAAKGLVQQAQLSADVGKLLLGHGMKTVGLKPDNSPVPFTAPKTLFNVPISGARRFSVKSLSLSAIRKLGKDAGATVNDIVLAICAGALRQYLLEKKALPEKTLMATVPVSVRQINRAGNQITYVGARLGTDKTDPIARIRAIGASTMQAKREVSEVSAGAATTFAVMAQGLVAVLNRFHLTEWVPPPANVTISNVPGPRKPLFFGQAKMLANYPLSVLVDGQALNITVISYCDSIDFGLMACRDAVPDVDYVGELIGAAFEELQEAVYKTGKPVGGKRKTLSQARKSKSGDTKANGAGKKKTLKKAAARKATKKTLKKKLKRKATRKSG